MYLFDSHGRMTALLFLFVPVLIAPAQNPGNATLCFGMYEAPDLGQSRAFQKVYHGLATSTNRGESWQERGWRTNTTNDICADPRNTGTLYLANDYGLLKSVNRGSSWKCITDRSIAEILAVEVTPRGIWIATPSGPHLSTDGGASWTIQTAGLPELDGTYVSDLCILENSLLIATAAGIFKLEEGKPEWVAAGLQGIAVDRLARHRDNPNRVAAVSTSSGLRLSADGGASWENPAEQMPTKTVTSAAFDPVVQDRILVSTFSYGILETKDFGKTWTNTSGGLTNLNITYLFFDIGDPSIVYAGAENGSFVSRNSGKTWEAFTIRLGYISSITQFRH